VVQAIENLYPKTEDQKLVFDSSLRFKEEFKDHPIQSKDNLSLLAFLKISEGNPEKFMDLMKLPYLDNYQIWNDMIQPVLPNMKAADSTASLPADLTQPPANAAAQVFGAPHGTVWVKVQVIPSKQYAEDHGKLSGVYPVFVTVLKYKARAVPSRSTQKGSELEDEIA